MSKIRLLGDIDLTKREQKIKLKKNDDIIIGDMQIYSKEVTPTSGNSCTIFSLQEQIINNKKVSIDVEISIDS